MNLRLENSEAAHTYSEEIREKAVSYASDYVFFSVMTYVLLGLGLGVVIFINLATNDFLPNGFQTFLVLFLTCLIWQLIKNFMGRRILISRRDEILRLINGGFNGPDSCRPPLTIRSTNDQPLS